MSVGDLLSLMGGTGGGVGIIVLALFITGYIVPKSRVEEIKEERDEWRRKSEIDEAISRAVLEQGVVAKDVLTKLHKELSK